MDTEPKRPWLSMHVAFCIVLILVSGFVIVESLRTSLPMVAEEDATVLDMPGLAPIVCSVLLAFFSIWLLIASARKGGSLAWFGSREFFAALRGPEAVAVYKVFALLIGYAFLLWPNFPFWFSTFVFLIAFMWAFKSLSFIGVIVAAATSMVLWFVFNDLFNVLLPSRFFFVGG